MKILLTYQDDKELTVVFDDGVEPREMIDFVFVGERLRDIYELLKKEKER